MGEAVVLLRSRPCRYCRRVVEVTWEGGLPSLARPLLRHGIQNHEVACVSNPANGVRIRREVPLESFRDPDEPLLGVS